MFPALYTVSCSSCCKNLSSSNCTTKTSHAIVNYSQFAPFSTSHCKTCTCPFPAAVKKKERKNSMWIALSVWEQLITLYFLRTHQSSQIKLTVQNPKTFLLLFLPDPLKHWNVVIQCNICNYMYVLIILYINLFLPFALPLNVLSYQTGGNFLKLTLSQPNGPFNIICRF